MLNLRQRIRPYDPRPLVNRLLHPARRHLAQRALSQIGVKGPVLVVCYGNICRSPYAAAVLREKLEQTVDGAGVEVTSAGFTAPGRPCPRGALVTARERGYDLAGHISRRLTRDLVKAAQWVVVMDSLQAAEISKRFGKGRSRVLVLGDFDPLSTGMREIEDPWSKPDEVFGRSYDRIDRCVDGVLRVLKPVWRGRGSAADQQGGRVAREAEVEREVTAAAQTTG